MTEYDYWVLLMAQYKVELSASYQAGQPYPTGSHGVAFRLFTSESPSPSTHSKMIEELEDCLWTEIRTRLTASDDDIEAGSVYQIGVDFFCARIHSIKPAAKAAEAAEAAEA